MRESKTSSMVWGFAAALYPLLVLYHAWALSVSWNWTMPAYSLPHISIPQAIGLFAVIHFFTGTVPRGGEPTTIDSLLFLFVRPLWLVGMAYVARFML